MDKRESAAALGFSAWGLLCVLGLMSYFLTWLPSADAFGAGTLVHMGVLLLKLALFWFVAWSWGAWCLAALELKDFARSERALAALGLGAGCLGLAALGLGACGLSSAPLFAALLKLQLLAGAATVLLKALARPKKTAAAAPALGSELSPAAAVPLVFLAAYGLFSGLVAFGPPTSYDGLVYHMALPDLFLRHGRISPTPFHVYSGIPFGVEMLYMWALPLDPTGTLCQLLHWSLGLLTAAAIVAIGRRLGSLAAGIWSAAIFYTNPMVLVMSSSTKIELGSSFYLALTLFFLVAWSRKKDGVVLVLAGLFAGLTLGTKYQQALLLPAVAAFLVHAQGARAGARSFAKVGLVAALVAAPWLIKNLIFYGNPIYPFMDAHFNAASVVIPGALSASARPRPLGETFGTAEGLRDFLLHVWRYSFLQTNDLECLLSVVYVALLPLFFVKRPSRPIVAMLIFGGALWLPMNLVTAMTRFSIPALVPLSLACGLMLESLPSALAAPSSAVLAVAFAVCGFCGFNVKDMPELWQALRSPRAAADYLAAEHSAYPSPPYAAYQWANLHLPARSKVLLVGDQRGFYLHADRFASSLFAQDPLAHFAKASSSGDDLYRRLRGEGITHLFLNKGEFLRTSQSLALDADAQAVLRDFWRGHLELAFPDYPREPDRVYDFAFLELVDAPRTTPPLDAPNFLLTEAP
jgi:hypothetical protein